MDYETWSTWYSTCMGMSRWWLIILGELLRKTCWSTNQQICAQLILHFYCFERNPTVNITGLTMKWFSSKIGKEGKKPSFDSHRWVDELKWQRVTLPLSCARLETMTMRLGADFFSKSRRQLVRRKCPRWLTPNCISKPSSVVHLGHIMTPNKQQKHLYGEN